MKRFFFVIAGCLLFLFQPCRGQQAYFSVKNGIPHLPVLQNTGVAEKQASGMMIYSLDEGKPLIYNGSNWVDFCSIGETTTEYDTGGTPSDEEYFVVKKGVPYMPVKTSVPAGTPMSGDMYYSTVEHGILVYNGSTWELIRDFYVTTDQINANSGKFRTHDVPDVAQIPVLVSAPSGVATGAIYIHSQPKELRYYNGLAWLSLSCVWSCGSDLTLAHNDTKVAAETVTVTYKTVLSNLSGENKCWIAQNLGASKQATSATDNSVEARGWFWQFNNMQGHYNKGADGSTDVVPAFSDYLYNQSTDWLPENDPCTILLKDGWRIPTQSEWNSVITDEGAWTRAVDSYNSVLKLHMAGYIEYMAASNSATFLNPGSEGRFSSSTRYSSTNAYYLKINGLSVSIANSHKYHGYSLRCLKD